MIDCISEHFFFPVDKLSTGPYPLHHLVFQRFGYRNLTRINYSFIMRLCFTTKLHIFFGRVEIEISPERLNTQIAIIVDFHFSGFTTLGSHQYHTVTGTCTINSLRRSIFQNFNRFNIIRTQRTELCCTGRRTIYNI